MGLGLRAIRSRRGLRQADVARAAGVSQEFVSKLELGRLERVGLGSARRVASVLDASLDVQLRWRGGDLDRLLDEQHARVVGLAVATLRRSGWEMLVEWSFARYGERGSVDVVGWHAHHRALLVVEAKSRLVDLQDLLATLDRKVRLARLLLAEERGWRARQVGHVVVVPRTTHTRTLLARHAAIFEAALPDRNDAFRAWLAAPESLLSALWLVSPTTLRGGTHAVVGRGRVRRAGPRSQGAVPR